MTKIPEKVLPIYRQLAKRYKLDFENVTIRGKRFSFLHLQDIEPLIAGKDIFANSEEFPFWVKIWESSVVLADFMASMEPDSQRKVLELGAGLGVTGIVAAGFGHKVLLTDYQDEILDFEKVSAAVNKCDENTSFKRLDWLKPDDLGKFEMIIASEVLFHPKFFEPLLNVFRKYLAPKGVIYMAHDVRRKSLGQFLPLCEKEYDIAMQKRVLRSDDEKVEVLLTRLVPKGIA